jgi:(p)ppGpp synthase/HD superfamily hydrolase
MLLVKEALNFANKAHEGQFRKDGKTPYVLHVARVQIAAAYYGLPVEVQAAAALHDTIEMSDGEITEVFLAQRFSSYIAQLVMEVTNPSEIVPEYMELLRPERQKINDVHLSKASVYAKCIKLLDIADNMEDLDNEHSKKFQKMYIDEKKNQYTIVADANWRIAKDTMLAILEAERRLQGDV